jgi:hypothetical protein
MRDSGTYDLGMTTLEITIRYGRRSMRVVVINLASTFTLIHPGAGACQEDGATVTSFVASVREGSDNDFPCRLGSGAPGWTYST